LDEKAFIQYKDMSGVKKVFRGEKIDPRSKYYIILACVSKKSGRNR